MENENDYDEIEIPVDAASTFSPELAAQIIDMVRKLQASGVGEDKINDILSRSKPSDVAPIYVSNVSGETIPAYGCMQVVGTVEIGGQNYLEVDKPADTTGAAGGFLFNSHREIPADETGVAQPDIVVRAIKSSSIMTGANYRPVVSAWTIAEHVDGTFVMAGADDISTDVVKIVLTQPGCCGGCEGIDPLPTITIIGMTGEGWVDLGGDDYCCYKQEFNYDEEQPTVNYYADLLRAEVVETWSQTAYFVIHPAPIFYTSTPAEIDRADICCYTLDTAAGTRDWEKIDRAKYRARMPVRQYGLTVYLRKFDHVCLGSPSTEKYIVTVVQKYIWGLYIQSTYYQYISDSVTVTNACYELASGYTPFLYEDGVFAWDDWTGADELTIYSLPTDPDASPFQQLGTFVRSKFYDVLPSSITLGASDVPTTPPCPVPCFDINEPNNETCYEIPDLPPDYVPTHCDDADVTTPRWPEVTQSLVVPGGICAGITTTTRVTIYVPGDPCATFISGDIPIVGTASCDTITGNIVKTTGGINLPVAQIVHKDSCKTVYADPCDGEVLGGVSSWGWDETAYSLLHDCTLYYDPDPVEICVPAPDVTLTLT